MSPGPFHVRGVTNMIKFSPVSGRNVTVSLLGWRQNIREVRPMAKSKYETHVLPNLEKVEAWARAGATAKDISAKLHIAYSTFRNYVDLGQQGDERYQALSEAFARGCEVSDDAIETALFNRAKGIQYEEETYERKVNKETGETEVVLTKKVTKFIPPDPTSAMFWLTNRRPERWKYKPQEDKEDDPGQEGGVVLLPAVDDTLMDGGGTDG